MLGFVFLLLDKPEAKATISLMNTINPIADLPRVAQYMGVWADQTRDFGAIQVRIIGYSAYNAFGLIGSECNGIAILNETEKTVITDEIGKQLSGYYGPSPFTKKLFEEIANCDEAKLKEWCLRGRSRIA